MGGRVGGVGRDHSLCSIIMQLRWLQQWVVTGPDSVGSSTLLGSQKINILFDTEVHTHAC